MGHIESNQTNNLCSSFAVSEHLRMSYRKRTCFRAYYVCMPVIFLPARPASQTHDSHKGRMILNHVNPAGRIKNCGEKSAFKNLQLSF